MYGRTHAIHGAIAGTMVAPLTHNHAVGLLCVGVGALTAQFPDVDHPKSWAGKALAPVRWLVRGLPIRSRLLRIAFVAVVVVLAGLFAFMWLHAHRELSHPTLAVAIGAVTLPILPWLLVRGLSQAVGLPAHRGLTHTVLAAVVVGAACLPILPWVVALAVTAGWLAALAGDWCTKTSLPFLWWPFAVTEKVSHKGLRITTGKWVERGLIYPVSVLALFFAGWLAFAR